ncbi:hypothetical protein C8J57DRAFT_1417653 [Mycena rebaudengoi]|nr:hypothetical protein C8J57DRAFT_1417653 [Mycena rebaudengoi]
MPPENKCDTCLSWCGHVSENTRRIMGLCILFFLPPTTTSPSPPPFPPVFTQSAAAMDTGPPKTDQELMDGLSFGDVQRFRQHTYGHEYVRSNPLKFIDNSWIDIGALRHFLETSSTTPAPLGQHIKRNFDAPDASRSLQIIKTEPSTLPLPPIRTRILTKNNKEVIELLDSDSEPEPESPTASGMSNLPSSPAAYSEHCASFR